MALPAAAQTPTSPVTGARPGNVIGTAQSLPDGNSVSNVERSDTRSTIAPNLPSPNLPAGSPPRSYLEAAQNSLKLGRTGETQQALEQAEMRILLPIFYPAEAAGGQIRARGFSPVRLSKLAHTQRC